jgi:hypothetical protein
VVVYLSLTLALGFVLAMGVELFALFTLQSECTGETWLNRAVCGDSAWAIFGVCVGIAAVLVIVGRFVALRLRRPRLR